MKPTPRRQPANTAKAALQAHQNAAQGPLEPPGYVTLPEPCKPFWTAIVTARARELWTQADLAQAANLARVQFALQSAIVGTDEHAKLTRLSMALARAVEPQWWASSRCSAVRSRTVAPSPPSSTGTAARSSPASASAAYASVTKEPSESCRAACSARIGATAAARARREAERVASAGCCGAVRVVMVPGFAHRGGRLQFTIETEPVQIPYYPATPR